MSHSKHRRTLTIFILGSLSALSPFAIDMYLAAFPRIAAGLHTTPARVSLSVASYFAGLAAGQFIYGPLLDRFGRKRPLYAGLILFAAGSLLCMVSRTERWLVAMRFLQALGGCGAQVASMAMVRDFFPVQETAKIISLLILILGVSPLLAPTVGAFVAIHFGWQLVFAILAFVAILNLALVFWFLPEGHQADPDISFHPLPVLRNFIEVLKEPQFTVFTLSGSFAFSGLLVYVAASPIIFMEVFHVSSRLFGIIFAGLAVGFIGSNQINVVLLRKFTSVQIFKGALWVECPCAMLLLAGTFCHWLGLATTLALLFLILSSLGLAFPNAAALALVPFDHNIGSAAAMLGFLQIGVSGLASAIVGMTNSHGMLPITAIIACTSWLGLSILIMGRNRIASLRFLEEKGAIQIP